jgi:hypothetical protein
MRETGGDRYEIFAGLENGKVVAWAVDLRDLLIGRALSESNRIFGSGHSGV